MVIVRFSAARRDSANGACRLESTTQEGMSRDSAPAQVERSLRVRMQYLGSVIWHLGVVLLRACVFAATESINSAPSLGSLLRSLAAFSRNLLAR